MLQLFLLCKRRAPRICKMTQRRLTAQPWRPAAASLADDHFSPRPERLQGSRYTAAHWLLFHSVKKWRRCALGVSLHPIFPDGTNFWLAGGVPNGQLSRASQTLRISLSICSRPTLEVDSTMHAVDPDCLSLLDDLLDKEDRVLLDVTVSSASPIIDLPITCWLVDG